MWKWKKVHLQRAAGFIFFFFSIRKKSETHYFSILQFWQTVGPSTPPELRVTWPGRAEIERLWPDSACSTDRRGEGAVKSQLNGGQHFFFFLPFNLFFISRSNQKQRFFRRVAHCIPGVSQHERDSVTLMETLRCESTVAPAGKPGGETSRDSSSGRFLPLQRLHCSAAGHQPLRAERINY